MSKKGDKVNIGLLGIGTIGSGVYEQINQDYGKFAESTPIPAKITKILDKDPTKKVDDVILTNNPSDVIDDKNIDIIVSLMGGLDFEYKQIKEALKNKKHVITANKAVVGAHLKELTELAKENGVMFLYEASVGGGIPIIKSLEEQLRNNEINEIKGILNGTSNFILTKMSKDRADFEDSLKEAQAIGFAEANPAADLDGDDVARKIAILSSIAYGNEIKDSSFTKRGIRNIKAADITHANRMGYHFKHLGHSINNDGNVSISVEPVLFSKNSTMSNVENEFNIISINGDVIGELQFYGKGAGKDATANAVVNDVLDVLNAIDNNIILPSPELNENIKLTGNKGFKGEYYIRIDSKNSKKYSLSDIMEKVEEIAEINHINSSDGRIYIFTSEVASEKLEYLIAQLGLNDNELFYARIID